MRKIHWMNTFSLDRAQAVKNFQALIRLPTVSRLDETETDWAPFDEFIALLPRLYPEVHRVLEREIVAGHALLYKWAGATSEHPTVLMAHYDVVPATDEGWAHPPFSGEIVGAGDAAVIWGRGVIDDKASLVGILEAVEAQLAAGLVPQSDIYLAFTHNEEILGYGTPAIVDRLRERGIRPALVLDEGGIVGENIFPGVQKPVVYVGVSEKGTATLRISCTEPGGHASVMPEITATTRLAKAIVDLHDSPPAPFFNDVTRRMLTTIGPHSSGKLSDAVEALATDEASALDHFASVSPDANSMVRTTPVVTMIQAGQTANALPERASAIVNMRIAVGSSAGQAISDVRAAVSDPDIAFEVIEAFEPSPVSSSEDATWGMLEELIKEAYGDVLVTPYTNNGGTDSRNYTGISDSVYRFSPCDMTLAERHNIHAIDEQLRLTSFHDGCEFYCKLLERL
jgi:carboxypeptidase PM20D1